MSDHFIVSAPDEELELASLARAIQMAKGFTSPLSA